MGSELGLDLKLFAVKSVTGFLKDASAVDDASARTARLEDYVRSLEEEKKKIEAFRRELPLSVLLITEVIRGLREELEQCRGEWHAGGRHALEEFMPMKGKFEEEEGVKPEKDTRDKMNWMSSAQLWTDHYNNDEDSSNDSNNDNAKRKPEERDDEADRRHESKITRMESKPRSGGAFRPFKATLINGLSARKEEKVASMMPDLSLVSCVIRSSSRPVSDVHDGDRCSAGAGTGAGAGAGSKSAGRAASAAGAHLGLQGQQQPPRKARRCWSPELHRRFVMVLQQLGGAQVATPKQIRELMKVDGLTNDEVKSHLQKYRLHTRRMPNSSSAMGNRSVVVVGGLWVAQDHYTTSQQSASQSGSPQGPLQLAGSTRTVSVTAGDSYEEEDGKSESYSWK